MHEWRTIGELARAAKVPVSTLRYYERLGLLVPDARSDGNYRMYGPRARERLAFIRSAKDAGFTLDDVVALMVLREDSGRACSEVGELIDHRLTDLDGRLRELRRLKRTLTELRRTCHDSARRDHCLVLDELIQSGRERESTVSR